MLFILLFVLRFFRITSFLILLCFPQAITADVRAAVGEASPVGLWKTVDDRTHKPRAIIRIYEEKGTFFGKIENSFDPEELTARCEKCSGDRKGAPVIGMVIMRGITKQGSEYRGGEILDPETGSTYRCQFTISTEGEKLFVRGYLGLAVFGRTQTWTRAARKEISAD
jgi:uncharacterized protein (DUF2147 family)